MRRQDQVGGDGKDFEQHEDEDHADDAAETRGLLRSPRLLVEVGGHVPAPVVERRDQCAGGELRLTVEDGRREPAPRERVHVVAVEDREDGEEDEERYLNARHDDLHANGDGHAGCHRRHHREEEDGADQRHLRGVVGRCVGEESEHVGTGRHRGGHHEDQRRHNE